MFDGKALGQEVVAAVKSHVDRALAPMAARIEAIERRLDQPPAVDEDDLESVKSDIESLRKAIADIPEPAPSPELPDFARLIAGAVAEIPVPKDGEPGKSVTVEDVTPLIESAVARAVDEAFKAVPEMVTMAVDAIPRPLDGKNVEPTDVQRMIDEAVAKLPEPTPGKDADPDVIRQMVEAEVAKLPPAEPGKSVDPETIKAMVDAAVDALPLAENGKDADPAHVEALVKVEAERILAGWERPQDGKGVTIEELKPIVAEAVGKAVSAIPAPKDGVSLAGALIDRKGSLVVTLSDGSTRELGQVVGKDGLDVDMLALERRIGEMFAAVPKAKDGADGVGFDDMSCEIRDDGVYLVWEKGDVVKEARLPIPVDRGVWKEGVAYKKGEGVTWGGSFWICQQDTNEKPDAGKGWRLAVKRGRDGKDKAI